MGGMASLRDLGLSDYEARVYRALLGTGSATAKELSESSEVPMGRVYDVLGGLENHGLVRSQKASRPKKYVAVEPEQALEGLVDEKKRELRMEAERFEEIASSLADKLEVSEPGDERFWTAAVGPDESLDLLLERLDATEESVAMVVDDASPRFDLDRVGELVLDCVAELVEEGVEVSVLVAPALLRELGSEVQRRYVDDFGGHPRMEVRTARDLHGSFNVLDGREVCIEVTNPLSPDEFLAMIDIKDPGFAGRLNERFRERWGEARPIRE